MLVFWEKRLALLATPKTASTAIASAIDSLATLSVQRPAPLKHTTVQEYHRYIGPYLEHQAGAPFEVVALMREPQQWLGSWYRDRQRDDLANEGWSTAGVSFDAFVRAWCAADPAQFAQVGSQSKFLQPLDRRGLDRLFCYEDIGGFVDFLEHRLDCEVILPRLNVSPSGDTVLLPETEAMLRSHAAVDYAMYASLRGKQGDQPN